MSQVRDRYMRRPTKHATYEKMAKSGRVTLFLPPIYARTAFFSNTELYVAQEVARDGSIESQARTIWRGIPRSNVDCVSLALILAQSPVHIVYIPDDSVAKLYRVDLNRAKFPGQQELYLNFVLIDDPRCSRGRTYRFLFYRDVRHRRVCVCVY